MNFCFHLQFLRTRWENRGLLRAGTEFIYGNAAAQEEAHFFWSKHWPPCRLLPPLTF